MAKSLHLKDYSVLSDVRNYISRLHQIEQASCVRIFAQGKLLLIYGAPFYAPGSSLPLALSLRIFNLREDATLDVVVPTAELLDRVMRRNNSNYELKIPPQQLSQSWASLKVPQTGWDKVTEFCAQKMQEIALEGINQMQESLPENAGAPIVKSLREKIWGQQITLGHEQLNQQLAFYLVALGFLSENEKVKVYSCHDFLRFSTSNGHVIQYQKPFELELKSI